MSAPMTAPTTAAATPAVDTATGAAALAGQPPVLTLVPLTHPLLRAASRRPGDEVALHQAVMSLFPDDLPGRADGARAAAGVLHRLDVPGSGPARLLVQHACPLRPELAADPLLQHVPLAGVLERLQPGRTVRFRIVLNAVRVQTRTRKRIAVTDPEELESWGLERLASAGLGQVDLVDVPATALTRGRSPLWTARFAGSARVDDHQRVQAAVRDGVGRAKAFGCGLLSVIPQG